MQIRITTLSENTANYGFRAEWGLSMLVQVDDMNILMDAGLSSAAVHNAQLLGIDLSTIDRIVLSHGHADHTGGLDEVLRIKKEVEIIAHPAIWESKYTRRGQQAREHNISIPFSQKELEGLGARFHLTTEPVRISKHCLTTGEIPLVCGYEQVEDNLFVSEDGSLRQDSLDDDLALVVDADFGLVVVLGCAHRGMVNTLLYAQRLTGKQSVYAVIGGAHLVRASEERVARTINDLKEMGIKKLGVSHCTGFPAQARLYHEFGDAFFLNNAGTRITLS